MAEKNDKKDAAQKAVVAGAIIAATGGAGAPVAAGVAGAGAEAGAAGAAGAGAAGAAEAGAAGAGGGAAGTEAGAAGAGAEGGGGAAGGGAKAGAEAETGGGGGGGGGTMDKIKGAADTAKKVGDVAGKLFSPEGVLMFSVAAFFDGVGLLSFIPVVGWIIEMVSDIIATIVFIVWMAGTGRKGWWKLVLAAVIEIVPYLDDLAPFISLISMIFGIKVPASWIGFVYSVL